MAGETKEQQDAAKPKPKPAVAADAPAAPMTEAEVEELPKTIVRRLVKDKLAQIAGAGADGEGGAEVIVNKDAMAAFSESARIFIHYLSATSVPPPTSVPFPSIPVFRPNFRFDLREFHLLFGNFG
jgi:DNA polymerase epsilon subunit 3